jgi:hypothetical protein
VACIELGIPRKTSKSLKVLLHTVIASATGKITARRTQLLNVHNFGICTTTQQRQLNEEGQHSMTIYIVSFKNRARLQDIDIFAKSYTRIKYIKQSVRKTPIGV